MSEVYFKVRCKRVFGKSPTTKWFASLDADAIGSGVFEESYTHYFSARSFCEMQTQDAMESIKRLYRHEENVTVQRITYEEHRDAVAKLEAFEGVYA